jgi:ABC-type Fe3+-hydroxamate transport system substrate-binding protein
MLKKEIWIFALALLLAVGLTACSKTPEQNAQKSGKAEVTTVGQVKMNPHPASLEGKTVVLRWNSKLNGDKFLDRLAELLTQKVPGVKIVKMYRVDPSTVVVAETTEKSLQIADKIVAQKPDIVIASQAD